MLTFKEWLELTSNEKSEGYKELSDSDKFKVRMGSYYDRNDKIDISTIFMKEINKMYNEINNNGQKKY